MAGANSTTICYNASLQQCSSSIRCSHESLAAFRETMEGSLWRVNMLVLINAILAGVIVGIGAYAQRYRHRTFTRFIFLGANTLLLPISSYVVSTISTNSNDYINSYGFSTLAATCRGGFHYFTVVSWAFLVQITMINTTVIVAVDDGEGQNKGPPIQLLVQGLWTLYLGVSTMGPITANFWPFYLEIMLFTIICAKIMLKYYAFEKARRSLAFGHNPRLISGYMEQQELQVSQHGEPSVGEHVPPKLLVMGEEGIKMENQPHGYTINFSSSNGLVTVDMVWKLHDELARSTAQLKDMCLSFAFFKLLRCRFAIKRSEHVNVASVGTLNFFRSFLLREGNHKRVFGVIADELSFVQDYYFSSLPISYSKYWLPILGVSISLLSIVYCLLATRFIMMGLLSNWNTKYNHQVRCHFWCNDKLFISDRQDKNFGFFLFDDIPLFLLLILVVIAEVKYIASYICSNWTKVALICHYINHPSLRNSLRVKKWFGFLLKCKWDLMKHWDEEIGQSSILVLHPRTTLLLLLRRLLRLPDLDRSEKVTEAMKFCIIDALRDSYNPCQYIEFLLLSRVDKRFLWACKCNGTSEIILNWHIATCLLEVRYPNQPGQEQGSPSDLNNNKIVATRLSRYCAYLMAWSPDLLLDDDECSKNLYETVKKDAKCALAGRTIEATPEAEYKQVSNLLLVKSKYEVLKNGVRLAKQLVAELREETLIWKELAQFWSEMILYIAPSYNARGHLKAIARGGELITLLWALLTHAGVLGWPRDAGIAAMYTANSASV